MGWLRRQWWYLTLPRRAEVSGPPAVVQDERIQELLKRFDTDDRELQERIWAELPEGADAMPHLLAAYPHTRRMEARISMMYQATFHARVSEAAFQLGTLGCSDRSLFVRDRACGVLAYSLRRDALPFIRPLLRDGDPLVRDGAEGAVRAIKAQNHNLYWGDRANWVVNPEDFRIEG
jgi:hypothetical protein